MPHTRDVAPFDDYPATWSEAMRNRMNERHTRIMGDQPQIIKGQRVLDLGARDGRWTWAALNLEAKHVVAVEGRRESAALVNTRLGDMDRNRFDFIVGDIFDVLPKMKREARVFDTILCLGLFYHIYDHYALLKLMHVFSPQVIVIDSLLTDTQIPLTRVHFDRTNHPNNAIPNTPTQVFSPVGDPSTGLLRAMAGSLGYFVDFKDWSTPKSPAGLLDYIERRRFTAVLVAQESKLYPIQSKTALNAVLGRAKILEKTRLDLPRDATIPY